MGDYDDALANTLRNEGGYVNNPEDTPTNFGITLAVLQAWRRKPVSVADVMNMPLSEAKDIYKGWYWNAIRGDEIADPTVAKYFFDMAVLRGVVAASQAMQTVANVKADGVIGPKSVAAINALIPATAVNSFRMLCVRAFGQIVSQKPSKLQFLSNWLARAEDMAYAINELLRKMSVQGLPK